MAAENAVEAYRYLSQFRFSRHLRTVQRGEMPENNVGVSTLNATLQNMLKAVFSTLCTSAQRPRAPLRRGPEGVAAATPRVLDPNRGSGRTTG